MGPATPTRRPATPTTTTRRLPSLLSVYKCFLCVLTTTMSKAHPPELKKYMDKRVMVKLNGGRVVEGTLRGFDPFMNLVVDEGIEVRKASERVQIGVSVIRGSSIIMLEALDRIS